MLHNGYKSYRQLHQFINWIENGGNLIAYQKEGNKMIYILFRLSEGEWQVIEQGESTPEAIMLMVKTGEAVIVGAGIRKRFEEFNLPEIAADINECLRFSRTTPATRGYGGIKEMMTLQADGERLFDSLIGKVKEKSTTREAFQIQRIYLLTQFIYREYVKDPMAYHQMPRFSGELEKINCKGDMSYITSKRKNAAHEGLAVITGAITRNGKAETVVFSRTMGEWIMPYGRDIDLADIERQLEEQTGLPIQYLATLPPDEYRKARKAQDLLIVSRMKGMAENKKEEGKKEQKEQNEKSGLPSWMEFE